MKPLHSAALVTYNDSNERYRKGSTNAAERLHKCCFQCAAAVMNNDCINAVVAALRAEEK